MLFDRIVNRSRLRRPYDVSVEAAVLHQQLQVVDLHCDALISSRDLLQHGGYGHVDVPRMAQGNVALQAFTIVTQAPVRAGVPWLPLELDAITLLVIGLQWPVRTWTDSFERALYAAERLHTLEARAGGMFRIIRSVRDLDAYLRERQENPALTAAFLGVEGLHCLNGNLENLDVLYDAGVRMAGLVHLAGNDLGGAAHGRCCGGLTDFGKAVVRRMEEKRMLVDLAHASSAMVEDVLRIVTRPLVVSHTGFKGAHNNERNLDDAQAQRIAERGGVLGVGFFKWATGGRDVASIVRMLQHGINLVGAEHLALGSDFDGAVATPFDSAGMALITDGLIQAGVPQADIAGIMGENALRLLRISLPEQ